MSFISIFSVGFYVFINIIANILSTKIALLPVLGLSVSCGTLLYPFAFTARDALHKTVGKKNARKTVLMAGGFTFVMVLLFMLVGALPADPHWNFQEAYNNILLPVIRITFASIVAQIVSEFVDTEIFSFTYKKFKNDITASLASNFVALIVDSLLFASLAFLGAMPIEVVVGIVITNILIKLVMSLGSSPLLGLIKTKVEEKDM